jgi:hypothetical protein
MTQLGDPTFYRSPAQAAAAPAEKLAYVAAFDRTAQRPDALTVVDVDPSSARYGQVMGWADLPTLGDELHHFGWNACSSALAHEGHDMNGLQRRYLLLPGLRSSNVHVYDTHPIPPIPPWSRRSTPRSWRTKPATPGRTPCIAGQKESSCPAWEAPMAPMVRAGSRCSTTRPSTCWALGKVTADRNIWHMTPGGI